MAKNQTLIVKSKKINFNASLISSSKQLISSVISPHFGQNQTFECKIRPFSDLLAQKGPILDQSLRNSDQVGTLKKGGQGN